MSSSAVARWTGIVKMLGKIVDAPTVDSSNQDPDVVGAVASMVAGPHLPHAVWKKLVMEQKVPKALAQLCVRALQRHPHSAAPGLASLALDGLLASAALAPGSRLAAVVLKQLQDAGLLQHLPALMTHAAQDLAAAAAAPDVDKPNSPTSSSSAAAGPAMDQSTAAAAGTAPSRQSLAAQRMVAFRNAAHLLSISFFLTHRWPSTDDVAVCLQQAPALVQLVLAVFEAVRQLAAAGKEQPAVWHVFQCEAVHSALPAFCRMTSKLGEYLDMQSDQSAGHGTLPAVSSTAALLGSPELHRCFTLMTCVALAGTAPSYGRGSSDSAGTSSSSQHPTAQAREQQRQQSASAAAAGPAEVQAAAAGGQGTSSVAPAAADVGFGFPVSPLTSKLFEQLGLGHAVTAMQQAVQFAAGGVQATHRQPQQLAVVLEAEQGHPPIKCQSFFRSGPRKTSTYFNMLSELAAHHVGALLKGWQHLATDNTLAPTGGPLGRAQTSFLLSLLLLQWVHALPADCTELETEEACAVATTMTHAAVGDVKAAQSCAGALHSQHQQPTHLPAVGQQQLQQQPSQLEPQTVCGASLEDIQGDVLPLLIRLCKGRLQMLLQRQQQHQSAQQGSLADHALLRQAQQHRGVIRLAVKASDADESVAVAAAACAVTNCVSTFMGLCFVDSCGSCSTAAGQATSADQAAAQLAPESVCGLPAVVVNLLKSRRSIAAAEAHAADIIALLEGSMRLNASTLVAVSNGADSFTPAQRAVEILAQEAVALLLAHAAGTGSAAQRQCYSFLATVQKRSAWQSSGMCCPPASFAVAEGAAAMLAGAPLSEGAGSEQKQQDRDTVVTVPEQQLPAPDKRPLSGSAAVSLLPSLVIIGRFFLYMQAQLLGGHDEVHCEGDSLEPMQQYCLRYCLHGSLATLAKPVQQWLQAHSQQLCEAGYTAPQAELQLQELLQELEQLGSSVEGAVAGTVFNVREISRHLQLTGVALCSLTVPCLCNNPSCTNLSGLTEVGLVLGRSCICGGCRVARYCSRACQRVCWKQHKPLCAALAAAAAAAASTELPAAANFAVADGC